jgi:arylsulfatase A-like enzyme
MVFVLNDDQGYGDLGCYGSTTIATPNIDRLCRHGLEFEVFCVRNRCSLTRAAFVTGCHAQRVGGNNVVYRRERIGLSSDEISVAEILKKAGCARGIVGKWTNLEGGIHVRRIMRWYAVIPVGTVNSEIAGIIDMLPTFCALSGVEVPSGRVIDGRNIQPYLRGQRVDAPIDETFSVPGATIRNRDWKLLVKDQREGNARRCGAGESDLVPSIAGTLFNWKDDPGETTELSAKHPEHVQKLTRMMEEFMKELEANSRPVVKVAEDL